MNITLSILALVLITQAATILTVRRLVRRYCSKVFASGYEAGVEATRYGYDIGIEDTMSAVEHEMRSGGASPAQVLDLSERSIDRLIAQAKS